MGSGDQPEPIVIYGAAMDENSASARLGEVRARIANAAARARRNASDITLIAVSKTHAAETVRSLIAAGQTVFGENRVQEAQGKWPELRKDYPGVALHLIGPLQTNKARDAVALFDAIHGLDRDRLARAIAGAVQQEGRMPLLFVQVNTGKEPQKSGVEADEVESFVASCRKDYALDPTGLMCLPPFGEDPAPHFVQLAKLARDVGLTVLSMGMSDDFETAIAHGATHVRVGTALFGARE